MSIKRIQGLDFGYRQPLHGQGAKYTPRGKLTYSILMRLNQGPINPQAKWRYTTRREYSKVTQIAIRKALLRNTHFYIGSIELSGSYS